LLIVALGALLPAQEPQNLGVFPEALYAVQPALDQVLHLTDEQAAKIAARGAPFREELRLLEEEAAAAEPPQRGDVLARLDATRAEVEPTLLGIVESVLTQDQKSLVAMARDLHAAAVRGAAEELGERAKKGQTSRLEVLVHGQVLRLCPGLESTDAATSESALRASLAKNAPSEAQVTQPVTAGSQPPAPSETKPEKKRKDLLRDLAEGAAKAALENVIGELLKK
jgi:hypothetical protein